MPSNQSERVALVTGASSGIGAEIAERLARDGHRVVVNHVRDDANAQKLAQTIRQKGGHATVIEADVGDVHAVRAMFEQVETESGGIDVLVNNAGLQKLGAIATFNDAHLDQMLQINLKGTFYTLREAARRMRDDGRIVNLSSGSTLVLRPQYAVYASTKAAVDVLTAILAKEMRGRRITVNAIAPGPIATKLFLEGKTQEELDKAAKQSPFERLGAPADIANVVSFLVGPDAEWVNGQTLLVNGAYA